MLFYKLVGFLCKLFSFKINYLYKYFHIFLQPVAEEPFRFVTELDDLPRETLKQMIFAETVNFSQNL